MLSTKEISPPPPPPQTPSVPERSKTGSGNDGGTGGEGDRNYYSEYWNLFKSPVNNQIGTASLSIIVFYMVSGGPFGLEGSVRNGGFLYSILGFIFMPIVYSVPEALVTAELGSAFQEASGGVAWAEEAFGPAWAWIAGKNTLFSGVSNAAIFLVLPLEYFLRILNIDEIREYVRFLLILGLATTLNLITWVGLHVVGKMSMVIIIISLSPFIVMCGIGVFNLDPRRWLERPSAEYAELHKETYDGLYSGFVFGNIIWRPFINILFWKCNSFHNASFFAGDVSNVGKTFPLALFIAIVLVMITYLFPLLVAIGATTSTQSDWLDGYLSTAAEEIGGTWLGGWVVAAAAISSIAQYQAETSKNSFLIAGMAERRYIPKFLAARSASGTPTYSLLLLLILTVALGIASFSTLVEFVNINYSISALIYFASFVKLRISCPNLGRPFRVSLGTFGCVLIVIVPMALLVFIMLSASFETMLYGLITNTIAFTMYYYKDRIPLPDVDPYLKMASFRTDSRSSEISSNLDETENLAPSRID